MILNKSVIHIWLFEHTCALEIIWKMRWFCLHEITHSHIQVHEVITYTYSLVRMVKKKSADGNLKAGALGNALVLLPHLTLSPRGEELSEEKSFYIWRLSVWFRILKNQSSKWHKGDPHEEDCVPYRLSFTWRQQQAGASVRTLSLFMLSD